MTAQGHIEDEDLAGPARPQVGDGLDAVAIDAKSTRVYIDAPDILRRSNTIMRTCRCPVAPGQVSRCAGSRLPDRLAMFGTPFPVLRRFWHRRHAEFKNVPVIQQLHK